MGRRRTHGPGDEGGHEDRFKPKLTLPLRLIGLNLRFFDFVLNVPNNIYIFVHSV